MVKHVKCRVSPVRDSSRLPFTNGSEKIRDKSTIEIIPASGDKSYHLAFTNYQTIVLNHGDRIKSVAGTTAIWLDYDLKTFAFLLSPETGNSKDKKCRVEVEIDVNHLESRNSQARIPVNRSSDPPIINCSSQDFI